MKRILWLSLLLVSGCGGEDFSTAPMHVVIHSDATPEVAAPDSGLGGSAGMSGQGGVAGMGGAPESGQDTLIEAGPADAQDASPEAEQEASGQGGQAGSGGSTPEPQAEAGPEPQPEACTPDKCEYHATYYCGWLDDGCGGHEFCGHQYTRGSSYNDAFCKSNGMPHFSWLCPINVQMPNIAGPEPMPGCSANPGTSGQSMWCCPSDTLPPPP